MGTSILQVQKRALWKVLHEIALEKANKKTVSLAELEVGRFSDLNKNTKSIPFENDGSLFRCSISQSSKSSRILQAQTF